MKFHIKPDNKGEYRWNLRANNGKIIADSGEGYSSKQACKDGIALVKQCASAEVEED